MNPEAGAPSPSAADSFETVADVVVDARGLRCPLPVIRLAARAKEAPEGTVLEVLATDPAARADIPAWCRLREQAYLGSLEQREGTLAHPGGHTAYRVRITRAAPRTPAAPAGPPPRDDAGTPVEGQ